MLRPGLNLLSCQRSDTAETQAVSTACRCFPSADTPHPGGSSQGCTPCLEVSAPLLRVCSQGLPSPLCWWDAGWALSLSLCSQKSPREQSRVEISPELPLELPSPPLEWANQLRTLLISVLESCGRTGGKVQPQHQAQPLRGQTRHCQPPVSNVSIESLGTAARTLLSG